MKIILVVYIYYEIWENPLWDVGCFSIWQVSLLWCWCSWSSISGKNKDEDDNNDDENDDGGN